MSAECEDVLVALSIILGVCTVSCAAGDLPWPSGDPVSVEYEGISLGSLFRMRVTPSRLDELRVAGAVDVRVWIRGNRPSVVRLFETLKRLEPCNPGESPGDVRGRLKIRTDKVSMALYVGRFGKVYVDGQWFCTEGGTKWMRDWLVDAITDVCGEQAAGTKD